MKEKTIFIIGLIMVFAFAIAQRFNNDVVIVINKNNTPYQIKKIHEHKDCSKEALSLVKKFEGYSDSIYVCPGGQKTIGYGFTYPTIWDRETISKFEADSILKDHLAWCISMAEKDGICCERASAVGSFIYNLGYGNYKKSKVRDAVLNEESLDVMLNYCYASGKRLRGLEKRRSDELAMYNSF
jgi:lysozyme